MREYLDPVFEADRCAEYVKDIGIAANNAMDLTRNIGAVFKCIRQTGLKLTVEKNIFGVKPVEFLGKNNFTRRNHTTSPENSKFSRQT